MATIVIIRQNCNRSDLHFTSIDDPAWEGQELEAVAGSKVKITLALKRLKNFWNQI